MNLFDTISSIGLASGNSIANRYIKITNRVSLLISVFVLVAAGGAVLYFGFTPTVLLTLSFVFVPLFSLALNHFGFTDISRFFLSISICLAALVLSLFDKTHFVIIEETQFYEFRVFMLGASILPFILFSLSETKLWVLSLLTNLLLLLLYDSIHNFFSLGYFQLGLKNPEYPFQNLDRKSVV